MRYPTAPCKNCQLKYRRDFKFCPHCGQQSNEELTVGLLFYNTVINYFSFDARFFKSIYPLLFKPGYLATAYIKGKRSTYLHPAQLYLFVSVLFFFLMTTLVVTDNIRELDNTLKKATLVPPVIEDALSEGMLNSTTLNLQSQQLSKMESMEDIINEGSNSITLGQFNSKKLDSLIGVKASEQQILKAMGMKDDAGVFKQKFYTQGLKLYKQRTAGNLLKTVYETLPIALFILLPIFAFLLKLFFYRSGGYANHLVFGFYFFSFLFFVFTVQLIVNSLIDIQDWIDLLVTLSVGIYLTLAIKQFYGTGWSTAILKTAGLAFFYFLFVIPSAMILLFVYGFMMY